MDSHYKNHPPSSPRQFNQDAQSGRGGSYHQQTMTRSATNAHPSSPRTKVAPPYPNSPNRRVGSPGAGDPRNGYYPQNNSPQQIRSSNPRQQSFPPNDPSGGGPNNGLPGNDVRRLSAPLPHIYHNQRGGRPNNSSPRNDVRRLSAPQMYPQQHANWQQRFVAPPPPPLVETTSERGPVRGGRFVGGSSPPQRFYPRGPAGPRGDMPIPSQSDHLAVERGRTNRPPGRGWVGNRPAPTGVVPGGRGGYNGGRPAAVPAGQPDGGRGPYAPRSQSVPSAIFNNNASGRTDRIGRGTQQGQVRISGTDHPTGNGNSNISKAGFGRSESVLDPSTDPFAKREGKTLLWRNISIKLAGNKLEEDRKLLDGVWGEVPPTETTAVMGPSGAGAPIFFFLFELHLCYRTTNLTSLLFIWSSSSSSQEKLPYSMC